MDGYANLANALGNLGQTIAGIGINQLNQEREQKAADDRIKLQRNALEVDRRYAKMLENFQTSAANPNYTSIQLGELYDKEREAFIKDAETIDPELGAQLALYADELWTTNGISKVKPWLKERGYVQTAEAALNTAQQMIELGQYDKIDAVLEDQVTSGALLRTDKETISSSLAKTIFTDAVIKSEIRARYQPAPETPPNTLDFKARMKMINDKLQDEENAKVDSLAKWARDRGAYDQETVDRALKDAEGQYNAQVKAQQEALVQNVDATWMDMRASLAQGKLTYQMLEDAKPYFSQADRESRWIEMYDSLTAQGVANQKRASGEISALTAEQQEGNYWSLRAQMLANPYSFEENRRSILQAQERGGISDEYAAKLLDENNGQTSPAASAGLDRIKQLENDTGQSLGYLESELLKRMSQDTVVTRFVNGKLQEVNIAPGEWTREDTVRYVDSLYNMPKQGELRRDLSDEQQKAKQIITQFPQYNNLNAEQRGQVDAALDGLRRSQDIRDITKMYQEGKFAAGVSNEFQPVALAYRSLMAAYIPLSLSYLGINPRAYKNTNQFYEDQKTNMPVYVYEWTDEGTTISKDLLQIDSNGKKFIFFQPYDDKGVSRMAIRTKTGDLYIPYRLGDLGANGARLTGGWVNQ